MLIFRSDSIFLNSLNQNWNVKIPEILILPPDLKVLKDGEISVDFGNQIFHESRLTLVTELSFEVVNS